MTALPSIAWVSWILSNSSLNCLYTSAIMSQEQSDAPQRTIGWSDVSTLGPRQFEHESSENAASSLGIKTAEHVVGFALSVAVERGLHISHCCFGVCFTVCDHIRSAKSP